MTAMLKIGDTVSLRHDRFSQGGLAPPVRLMTVTEMVELDTEQLVTCVWHDRHGNLVERSRCRLTRCMCGRLRVPSLPTSAGPTMPSCSMAHPPSHHPRR